jgi:hypothetical protein
MRSLIVVVLLTSALVAGAQHHVGFSVMAGASQFADENPLQPTNGTLVERAGPSGGLSLYYQKYMNKFVYSGLSLGVNYQSVSSSIDLDFGDDPSLEVNRFVSDGYLNCFYTHPTVFVGLRVWRLEASARLRFSIPLTAFERQEGYSISDGVRDEFSNRNEFELRSLEVGPELYVGVALSNRTRFRMSYYYGLFGVFGASNSLLREFKQLAFGLDVDLWNGGKD